MWAVYKLRARTYFRSPSAYMLIFISIIYISIFGTIITMTANDSSNPDVLGPILIANVSGVILTMLIMSSASYQFGFEFLDMKKSVLLRRIGASKVNKSAVAGSFILWAITVLMGAVFFIFFLLAIFSTWLELLPQFIWSNVNWPALFVAIIIGAIGSYTVAFFFVAVANDTDTYNICSTLYFFGATALGGLFGGGAHWMYIIGHLTPIGWTADFLQGAMNGDQVFHIFNGYNPSMVVSPQHWEWGMTEHIVIPGSDPIMWEITLIAPWRASMDLFAPLIFTILGGSVALKKFKWS